MNKGKTMSKTMLRAALAAVLLMGPIKALNAGALDSLNVYPNPARAYLGDTEIVFDNVTDGTVRIYNVRGTKVREFSFGGVAFTKWDLRNDEGDKVGSGVYLYEVESGGQTKTGKVAVIR